jgi:tetratricopeptide (TPR) repeat protein
VVIFVILVAIIGFSKNQKWVKNNSILGRISDISLTTDTIQTRLWAWGSGLKGWAERPILGWGPENFMYLHMKYFNAKHFTGLGAETIWDRAHNMPLEILSTMGIVGLISYLSIFFFIFYVLFKRFKEKKISRNVFGILCAMIIAYFVQNLFIFDTTANYLMFFLILGYVNFLNAKEEEENVPSKDPSIILTAILIIIVIVSILQLNIKPAKANYASTRAILTARTGDVNKTLDYYKKALDYNTAEGAYEIRHKLASFIIQVVEVQRANGKPIEGSLLGILDYGMKEIEKNIEKYPQDTTPYLYLGRMYILLIEKDAKYGDLAEENIKKAIAINDNNPRIWYELGQAQLSQKKYQDAYQSFKTALNLNPDVIVSHWFVGMATYQLGNSKKDAQLIIDGIKEIEKALSMGYADYQDSLTDLNSLIEIYGKIKAYPRLIQFYKLVINIKPNVAQYHAGLAQAYAGNGDYQDAREEAAKALELEPKLKDAVDQFLKSLPN